VRRKQTAGKMNEHIGRNDPVRPKSFEILRMALFFGKGYNEIIKRLPFRVGRRATVCPSLLD
jgi:hypothetical protein